MAQNTGGKIKALIAEKKGYLDSIYQL